MKHIFVRPIQNKDIEKSKNWLDQSANYDAESVTYPKSFILAAYDSTGVVAYMPVQRVFMMESIGFRPELSDVDKAVAMKEFTQFLVTQSHIDGQGEFYFLGTNKNTNQFAEKQCYKELPWPISRVKLSDLEGK